MHVATGASGGIRLGERGFATLLGAGGLAAALGAILTLGRDVLFWDEAIRVRAGARLLGLAADGPAGVWHWLHAQSFYPPLLPALHAAGLALGLGPMGAAIVPSVAGYVVGGLLAALIARRLGAGMVTALGAAGLAWSAPGSRSLAASAMTEPLAGALAALVALLVLRLCEERTRAWLALGVVLTSCWLTKYDLGLVVHGAVLLSSADALLRRERRIAGDLLRAIWLSVGLGLAWLAVDPGTKVGGLRSFLLQAAGASGANGSERPFDPLRYLALLADGGGTGLAPLVALAALGGGILLLRSHRRDAGVLVWLPALWLVAFSASSIKWDRYLIPLTPLLAALAALALASLARPAAGGRIGRTLAASVLALLVGSAVVLPPAAFTPPLPTAALANARALLDEITPAIEPGRPVLLLGALNELSAPALELELRERGRATPIVRDLHRLEIDDPEDALRRALRGAPACSVVAIEVAPGGVFDTADWRAYHRDEPALVAAAARLARAGALLGRAEITGADGTRARIYDCVPSALD